MVVLLYSTPDGDKYNEFKGVFTDKDTALNTYLEVIKREKCKIEGDDYEIEPVEWLKHGLCYRCYRVWSNGPRCFDGYLHVEEVKENDSSYIW